MALKKWFRGGGGDGEDELTTEDLIVLERYEEAAERLKGALKANPEDLHARLRLAEVYSQLGQGANAVDEYMYVAEEYAQDGFYDKGIALLGKAARLTPTDNILQLKIASFQEAKRLEQKRSQAIEGVRKQLHGGATVLEFQRYWHNLARSSVVQHLPGEQLKRLFAVMGIEHPKAGAVLAEKEEKTPWLYLLLRGVVEARTDPEATPGLRSYSFGDILGDGVMFERTPWQAFYVVVEDATVFTLSRAGLEEALVGNPDPRGFLEALREQHNDRDLAASLRRIKVDP